MTESMAETAAQHVENGAVGEVTQYLTFTIRDEIFAIDILHIKEIIRHGQITLVPLMPDYVKGVINLRGEVVPVVDLQARFGRGSAAITRRTCIVIVEAKFQDQQQTIGALVESVSEVLEIPLSEIRPAPGLGTKIKAEYISGMGKVDDKFVILLNSDTLLTDETISSLAKATA